MAEDTAIFRKAKEHKKTIAGGVGGAGLMGLLAVALPYFQDQGDSNARQWQEISALKQRVVVIETRLEFMKQTASIGMDAIGPDIDLKRENLNLSLNPIHYEQTTRIPWPH